MIVETEHDFMPEVEEVMKDAEKSFHRFLKRQRNLYIDRLKEAPDLPTLLLLEAGSLRNLNRAANREEVPEPPDLFQRWVQVNVLYDSEEQLELWVEEGREWIENASVLSGAASLLELAVDIEFNARDERLLRWLSERSRRTAQLIQGVSDEDVLMTLWDVVYEGKYTIQKASEALQDSFAFSQTRAERIARTEIISASRSGQFHGDMQSGIVIGKKWMAAQQERTRDGHRAADGQVVPFDEPFYVANGKGQLEPLMFPGDTSLGASASNVIQCRCWYKRILEGEPLE